MNVYNMDEYRARKAVLGRSNLGPSNLGLPMSLDQIYWKHAYSTGFPFRVRKVTDVGMNTKTKIPVGAVIKVISRHGEREDAFVVEVNGEMLWTPISLKQWAHVV